MACDITGGNLFEWNSMQPMYSSFNASSWVDTDKVETIDATDPLQLLSLVDSLNPCLLDLSNTVEEQIISGMTEDTTWYQDMHIDQFITNEIPSESVGKACKEASENDELSQITFQGTLDTDEQLLNSLKIIIDTMRAETVSTSDSWNNKTYAVPPRVEVESSFSAQYIQNSSEAFRAEASLTSNFSGSQDISESPGSTISQSDLNFLLDDNSCSSFDSSVETDSSPIMDSDTLLELIGPKSGLEQNCESGQDKRPPKVKSKRKKKRKRLEDKTLLAKSILEWLLNNEYNPSYIKWISKNEGIFQITNSKKIAGLWGAIKGNPRMNYEKLSRALRHYYRDGTLERIENKKRLLYKFSSRALQKYRSITSSIENRERSDHDLFDSFELPTT